MINLENKTHRSALALAVILILTFAVYFQTKDFEFTIYDDHDYIVTNQNIQKGINLESLQWAFTTDRHVSWQPVVWLSFLVDFSLYGLDPSGYHLSNLFFHLIASILLYLVLIKSTGSYWKSIFVASVFALHPLHVESVAWIAERKDVLAALFWFLTMYLYIKYRENPRPLSYFLVFISFVFGLMSKPVLVTLPFVLVLFDYWPLKRFELDSLGSAYDGLKKSIIEKIPLFVLSVLSSVLTLMVQSNGGAVRASEELNMWYKLANSVTSYVEYILLTIFPVNLAVLYPHKGLEISTAEAVLCFLLIASATALVIFYRNNQKYLVVGWFWFLGILVPNIGIVQAGIQSHADRYMYIPIIGLAIIVAWGFEEFLHKYCPDKLIKTISTVLIVLSIVLMSLSSYKQTSYWKNDIILFGHAVDVTEKNHVAHNNMGWAYLIKNDIDNAIKEFQLALTIHPTYLHALVNLGNAYSNIGESDKALVNYKKALSIEPVSEAYNNMGLIYVNQNLLREAEESFTKAISLKPSFAIPYFHLAEIYLKNNNPDKAVELLKKFIYLKPQSPDGYFTLGLAYIVTGEYELSIKEFENVLKLDPGSEESKKNIKVLTERLNRTN